MSVVDMFQERLNRLVEYRKKLMELSHEIPDLRYYIMSVDAQIREMEERIERLTTLKTSEKCDNCQRWIDADNKNYTVTIGDKTICSSCLKTISDVYTTQEAESMWGLAPGTIKQDCRRGKLKPYVEQGLIKKSGKYWLVHAWVEEYYKQKKQQKENLKEAPKSKKKTLSKKGTVVLETKNGYPKRANFA